MKGIKRRWVRNYILTIVTISIVIDVGFIAIISNFYYNSAYQALDNKAINASQFYSKYLSGEDYSLDDVSELILKDFNEENLYEIQIYNSKGYLVKSSTGFALGDFKATNDVVDALKGKTGYYRGLNPNTDEKIISSAVPIYGKNKKMLGVIRNIASASKIDAIIIRYVYYSLLLFMFIYLMLTALSVTFSRSILNPIYEIISAARKMAEGKFNTRIEDKYNDEFGVLASTLNYLAEEIQNTEKLKNEFISSISHEIRTPLTAIAGWGETIIDCGPDEIDDIQRGLKIIVKETNRLSSMVEDLLDFSKMESGRLTLYLETFSITDELAEISEIYKRKAQAKGVDFIFDKGNHDVFIEADKNRLKQVIINLVDNAIKFTDLGKKVELSLSTMDEFVVISIEDQGIGIDHSDIELIKKKFYKVSNKTSGSGLGLAIAQEIIQLHGGEIVINSKRYVGTKIDVKLKCCEDKGQ